ncbi:MAG: SDR family NAD(P)-dependent oxidoreductase [Pseudomonadota bacterium]|nr:SDR family NAD(P)-dependent oxidoreductase [Pseudomonadota bacterium]
MTDRLRGKTAIVVGGGQAPGETMGNGRATALTFAREGARLVIADLDLAAAEDTVRMVDEAGGEAVAIAGDVTSEADCARFAQATVDAYGRIDILHNNVGIGAGDSGPTKITAEAWRRILDVNLTGMLLTAKAALPIMRKQRSGVITSISSMISITDESVVRGSAADQTAGQGQVAYRVSKTGVNSLTESLAMSEAPYNIRVNAILPGLMETPNAIEALLASTDMTRDALNKIRDDQVPLGGRQGTAWDVANAALFLASDEARFITGVLLPVDGGQNLRRG